MGYYGILEENERNQTVTSNTVVICVLLKTTVRKKSLPCDIDVLDDNRDKKSRRA